MWEGSEREGEGEPGPPTWRLMRVPLLAASHVLRSNVGAKKWELECLRGDQRLNAHTRQLVTTRSAVACKQGPHIGYKQPVWSCVCSGKGVCEREGGGKNWQEEIFSDKKNVQRLHAGKETLR